MWFITTITKIISKSIKTIIENNMVYHNHDQNILKQLKTPPKIYWFINTTINEVNLVKIPHLFESYNNPDPKKQTNIVINPHEI